MASTWHVNKLLELRIKREGLFPPRTLLMASERGKPRFITDLSETTGLPRLSVPARVDFIRQRMGVTR